MPPDAPSLTCFACQPALHTNVLQMSHHDHNYMDLIITKISIAMYMYVLFLKFSPPLEDSRFAPGPMHSNFVAIGCVD